MPSNEYERGRQLLDAGDWQRGIATLELGASQGDPDSANYLGYVLLHGQGTDAADAEAARRWFQRAFELGSVEGAFQLGLLELEATDETSAFSWFEKAAEQGHIPAAQRMGYIALHGRNLSEKDLEFGFEMMKWAAHQGHAFALRDLSIALRTGVCGRRSLLQSAFFRLKSIVALFRLLRHVPGHDLLR